jgi:hypothetical protein
MCDQSPLIREIDENMFAASPDTFNACIPEPIGELPGWVFRRQPRPDEPGMDYIFAGDEPP